MKNSDHLSFDETMKILEDQQRTFRCSVDSLFGYILYLFRTELGVSQESMGFQLGGISKSGYSKLENGISSLHISHVYMLSHITNVPRKFIYDLLDYLTEYCLSNGGRLYVGDDIAVNAFNENDDYPELKKNHEMMREKMTTPLKEYSAFFGLDHVAKLSSAINIAIKKGGKLPTRSPK